MSGRPPSDKTVQFRRVLDNPKRAILMSAGQGNISEGFENLIALYHHVYSLGYRVGEPMDRITLITNDSHLQR
jgi:hypothetical protein